MNTMKKYWLVLSPNTFMWLKGEEGLLYHAVSHAQVSFKNVGALRLLTEWINDIDNLYRVELTEETLRQPEVNEWIRQVVDKECGKLVENDDVNNCPVSLKPVLKLQDGVQYYEWLHRQGTDGSVIQNLHNIVFYLNGSASGDEWLHRQLIYPSATETVADRMRVVHFARNARQSPYLLEISLVGNLFAIPQLAEEVEALQTICPVMLYVTVEDALHALPQVKVWADRQAIRISHSFIRQTLNIADFGKLYIEPDGKVYANLNDKSIGMIDNSPHDLVYRELTEGNAWLHIRNEEPCCECVYQWLCPSPSNYERVIGKPNLCTKIKK